MKGIKNRIANESQELKEFGGQSSHAVIASKPERCCGGADLEQPGWVYSELQLMAETF